MALGKKIIIILLLVLLGVMYLNSPNKSSINETLSAAQKSYSDGYKNVVENNPILYNALMQCEVNNQTCQVQKEGDTYYMTQNGKIIATSTDGKVWIQK